MEGRIRVSYHALDEIEDARLEYAVSVARCGGRWVFCYNPARGWELPGGRREPGEAIVDCARRELREETGAVEFALEPVCVYSVTIGERTSFGLLCFARIERLGPLPGLEIERVELCDRFPRPASFPGIQPQVMDRLLRERGYPALQEQGEE